MDERELDGVGAAAVRPLAQSSPVPVSYYATGMYILLLYRYIFIYVTSIYSTTVPVHLY